MGQVFVNIEVGHERGGEMVSVPDVLVDTGSAHTTLPATLMEGLHIETVEAVDISLPGGRIVTWNIGQARMRLAGHPREWTCPVYLLPRIRVFARGYHAGDIRPDGGPLGRGAAA